jgi:hypothetical protein
MKRAAAPPLTRRQFAFVGAAVCAAALAHVSHLPLAITAIVCTILILALWRGQRVTTPVAGWLKLLLIVVFLLILLIQFRNPLGREPGSARACAMLALTLLETRSRRERQSKKRSSRRSIIR